MAKWNRHFQIGHVLIFLGFGLTSCSGGEQADEPVQAVEDGAPAADSAAVEGAPAEDAPQEAQQDGMPQDGAAQDQPLVADDSAPMGGEQGIPESSAESAPKEEDIAGDGTSAPPAMVDSSSDTVNAELAADAPTAPVSTDTSSDSLAGSLDDKSVPVADTQAQGMPGQSVSSPGAAKFVKGKHDDKHQKHAASKTMPAATGNGDASNVIQPGDTLAKDIGEDLRSYKQWNDLASLNDLNPPYKIFPGHELRYDSTHPKAAAFAKGYQAGMKSVVVEKGDTLSKIAAKLYGSTGAWQQLASYNKGRIADPNRITVGMKLFYVDKDGSTAAVSETPKAEVVKTQKPSAVKQTVHKAPHKTPKRRRWARWAARACRRRGRSRRRRRSRLRTSPE